MKELKNDIFKLVEKYYIENFSDKPFKEGETKVSYSGRVFDQKEMCNLVDSALDFYLTEGKYCDELINKLKLFLNVDNCCLVNSGSSANLLAFYTLTSYRLGDKRVRRGDEVITVAGCFPTTVSPIVQYGAIPVYVDMNIETLNIDETQLEKALSPKTKAVMLAHTLGNPFNIKVVKEFCDKNDLWLIEDCADALFSKYDDKYLGTFGDIGTTSFFPAHFLTSGEGGAVYTNNKLLFSIMSSFRSWGRDYKCPKCVNPCNKRYDNDFDYDCRYTFSEFGFNLKMTEMQASIGSAQMDKIPDFISKRKSNYNYLYKKLIEFDNYLIFPESLENTDVCWFCFPITVRENTKFKRIDLIKYLEENKIETRMLFAGNILRQKCSSYLFKNTDYLTVGFLDNTDYIMDNTFFIGNYPNISEEQLDYVHSIFTKFFETLT